MKILKITLILFFIISCNKKDNLNNYSDNLIKGKLVVKGICMNYVIRVFDNNLDNSLIENEWIHEFTKETYKDVFRLGSVCNFPEYLNEGDKFYFTINEYKTNDLCVVCLAYSPTPEKILYINIC